MRKFVPLAVATLAAMAMLGAPAIATADEPDCESKIQDAEEQVSSARSDLAAANKVVQKDSEAVTQAKNAGDNPEHEGAQEAYDDAVAQYKRAKKRADDLQADEDSLEQRRSALQKKLDKLPAESHSNGTAVSFFNSIGATDAANLVQNAVDGTQPYARAHVNLHDSNDATSLKNMLIGLQKVEQINSDRVSDDNFPGRQALSTDPYLMAAAAITADEARYSLNHQRWFNTYENLSWGTSDPVEGWYNEEKKIYDSGNHDYNDAGHYLNIMSDDLLYVAVGYSLGGDWVVNSSMEGDDGSLPDQGATSAENMIDELQNYIDSTSTGSASNDRARAKLQKQIDDLSSRITDDVMDMNSAQDDIANAEHLVSVTKRTLDNTPAGLGDDDENVLQAEVDLLNAQSEQKAAQRGLKYAQQKLAAARAQCNVTASTITYYPNNGQKPFTITYREKIINAPKTPVRKGYKFEGWSYDREGLMLAIFPIEAGSVDKMYAQWDKNPAKSSSGSSKPGKPAPGKNNPPKGHDSKPNKPSKGGNKPGDTFSYIDVNPSDWFYNAVQQAGRKGLMTGYNNGRFGPHDPITREQAAVTLYRAAGRPTVEGAIPYKDYYKVSSWAYDPIKWAFDNNVMHGYGSSDMFGPQDHLTRAQCATILARINGDPAPSVDDGMNWAVEHGVIHGWPDQRGLDPNGRVDRAQMAQILVNASNNGYLNK